MSVGAQGPRHPALRPGPTSHGGSGSGVRLGAGAPALCARGVTVRLGSHVAVRDASIAVAAGEVLALVGPNGAGKSTLLGALAGDVRPHSGRVTVAGRDLAAYTTGDLARARAVHLQHQHVAFAYTVREVVEMGRAPWPAGPQDDAHIAAALAATDAAHLERRLVSTLSGGELARIALARTLAQNAPILLLDEPTAAVDLGHQERILAEVRRRAAGGAAVVVVLHDLRLAAAYCDRVALLVDGEILAAGPPDRVLRSDTLSDGYDYPVAVRTVDGALQIIPDRATATAPGVVTATPLFTPAATDPLTPDPTDSLTPAGHRPPAHPVSPADALSPAHPQSAAHPLPTGQAPSPARPLPATHS